MMIDELLVQIKESADAAETAEDREMLERKLAQLKSAQKVIDEIIDKFKSDLSCAFVSRIVDDDEEFYDAVYEMIMTFLRATCSVFHCGPAVDANSKEYISNIIKSTQSIISVMSFYERTLCEESEVAREVLGKIQLLSSKLQIDSTGNSKLH